MDLATALEWAAGRKVGVLITLRADGRPQSSDIAFVVDDGTFIISVTADRAKTANMKRDPRVVLHLTDPPSWSYLSFGGTVELSPVSRQPGDETSDRLVDYYERAAGRPHPDGEAYRQAMVDEKRMVVRLTPTTVTGQIN